MKTKIRLAPRWHKVLNDILENKARAILVVLAIAVGVIAFGSVFIARDRAVTDMNEGYRAIHPPEIFLYGWPFDKKTVQAIEQMPYVDGAEGWATAELKMEYNGQWSNIDLYAAGDFADMHVGRVKPISGRWPPATREVWLERATAEYLNVQPGQVVIMEKPDGTRYRLTFAGLIYDIQAVPPVLSTRARGYVTLETLQWLGMTIQYSHVAISLDDSITSISQIDRINTDISDRLKHYGYRIWGGYSPPPGKHWAADQVDAFASVLASIGALALVLSGFMVTNTISSLITQQKRQIGMMKTVGATGSQIFGLYLVEVGLYGLSALVISVPISLILGGVFAGTIAGFLNFDVDQPRLTLSIFLLQLATALVVPILAALVPTLGGIRATVREAISDYGIGADVKQGWLDRFLLQARVLSRPILVSLQNAFRRKGRMILTLITLTIAGAIFISVFNLRDALGVEQQHVVDLAPYDVLVYLSQAYPIRRLEQEAMHVADVDHVEGWGYSWVRRVKPDEDKATEDVEGNWFEILAPPIGQTSLHPRVLEGRWLLPGDENALVVSTAILEVEPDIGVGDTITLLLNGKERDWLVVGILDAGPGEQVAYANIHYFSRLLGTPGQVYGLLVFTQKHDLQAQKDAAQTVEERLKEAGLLVDRTRTMQEEINATASQFDLLTTFLLTMTVLLAIVGALGLASTMSLNVLERTREIGMMRAVGATDGSIRGIVIVEGSVTGLLSWLFAVPLSIPLTYGLCSAIGDVFFDYALPVSFAPAGIVLWLGIALAIAVIASLLPAQRAAGLSVREALAYE
jgi:putative ABC transport system permease protein